MSPSPSSASNTVVVIVEVIKIQDAIIAIGTCGIQGIINGFTNLVRYRSTPLRRQFQSIHHSHQYRSCRSSHLLRVRQNKHHRLSPNQRHRWFHRHRCREKLLSPHRNRECHRCRYYLNRAYDLIFIRIKAFYCGSIIRTNIHLIN